MLVNLTSVFEATVNEFPFVEQLPKRQKTKLVQVWELVQQMSEVIKTEGALLPPMLVAKALDLSRTRIDELCQDGRLKRMTIDGHVFITENSLVAFAKEERKNGRPLNLPTTLSETIRRSKKDR